MKSVGIYSPYIPNHFGGGERYILSIASLLRENNRVTLCVHPTHRKKTERAIQQYEKTFGIPLDHLSVESMPMIGHFSSLFLYWYTRKFDVFFAITDGSIFSCGAKKSFFISQLPWTRHLSIFEKLKLRLFWSSVLVYSEFVQRVLAEHWSGVRTTVLSPYVELNAFTSKQIKKEKMILSVGRFFSHTGSNSKRQDVLIQAFEKLVDTGRLKGWSLVLIGSVEDEKYYMQLQKKAKGYPIIFLRDCTYESLCAYYARASIYWHAAGFGVDEKRNPEQTEHFGITTLEAMTSGCVPLVVPKGGQLEILPDELFHWTSVEELVQKTLSTAKLGQSEIKKIQDEVRMIARKYDREHFEKKVLSCL